MARSLVDKLALRASQQFVSSVTSDREAGYYDGSEHAYRNAANIAKPYEVRRLALERAFADAKAAQGRHGLVTAWRILEDALSSVPEIPEES